MFKFVFIRVCFQDKEPRGIIPLENLSIREVDEPRKPVSSASKHSPVNLNTSVPKNKIQKNARSAKFVNNFCFLTCVLCFCFFFYRFLGVSPQNCFELYNPNHKGQVIKACKTEADGRVVEGNHVVYRISAPTPEEKEEWIKSIK